MWHNRLFVIGWSGLPTHEVVFNIQENIHRSVIVRFGERRNREQAEAPNSAITQTGRAPPPPDLAGALPEEELLLELDDELDEEDELLLEDDELLEEEEELVPELDAPEEEDEELELLDEDELEEDELEEDEEELLERVVIFMLEELAESLPAAS